MRRLEEMYSQEQLVCATCRNPENPELAGGHKCDGTAAYGGPCLCDGIHLVQLARSKAEDALIEAKIAEAQSAIDQLEEELEAMETEDYSEGRIIQAADNEPVKKTAAVRVDPATLDAAFDQTVCPICNNPKLQKDAAVEASRKAEMILVIRDIVTRFKRVTDARLSALATNVTKQISTIVAVSNEMTVTKHDLDISLINLADDLKQAFGIADTLDPKFTGEALFQEDEEGEPLDMFDAPEPGEDALFDKLTSDVNDVLEAHDPAESEINYRSIDGVGFDRTHSEEMNDRFLEN